MYLQVILNLLLVLAVAAIYLLLTWKLKKIQKASNKSLELVSQLSFGPKEKIIIIKAEDRKLLLGVTATQINTLADMSDDMTMQKLAMEELANNMGSIYNDPANSRNIQ